MRLPPNFRDFLPYPIESLKQVAQLIGQPQWISAMKEAAEKMGMKEPFGPGSFQQVVQQAGKWVEAITEPWLDPAVGDEQKPGINATGEIFSSRWTNSPCSLDIAGALVRCSSDYTESTKAIDRLQSIVTSRMGAADVVVFANTSSALLALSSSYRQTKPTRWILPRVDCVRIPRLGIPGPSNLRTPLDHSGVVVAEIGSNQDCSLEDFQTAIESESDMVLVCSPNSILDDTERKNHYAMAREASLAKHATLVEVLFNGSLHPIPSYSDLTRSIESAWSGGNHILLIPGEFYLGGPECCLALTQNKSEPWTRMQRMVNDTGLEASAFIQSWICRELVSIDSEAGWLNSSVGQCLTTSLENLNHRAERAAIQLRGTPWIDRASVTQHDCRLGNGIWSQQRLKSAILELFPKEQSPTALANWLFSGERPIWCNVQSDHVDVVFRTMTPDHDRHLIQRLCDSPSSPDVRTESES